MMLHRHFEETGRTPNMTTLADVTPNGKTEFVSEIFPPEVPEEAPKRRSRPRKKDE